MPGSSMGTLFRVTTFGESHGPAIGAIVDGCPAGLWLCEDDIQKDLNRRRPGQSHYTTQRQEEDCVRILSGVFAGQTTGTPIGLLIENNDARSKDYEQIKDKFRPGHADFTYWSKYGIRDYRGGGRSSARETAMRVAAGAIARKLLHERYGVVIRGALIAMGNEAVDRTQWDWEEVANNPFFSPDATAVPRFAALLDDIRRHKDSIGAMVEVVAEGVPAGWGEPVFDRLDADLAKAMMCINAVKGVEIGEGMAVVGKRGSQHSDEMAPGESPSKPRFLTNHAGGILGGISNGENIVVRMAIKPTSSIAIEKNTVDCHGQACTIQTLGRHDPCVGIRAVPVAEAMMAMVLADHGLQQQVQKF